MKKLLVVTSLLVVAASGLFSSCSSPRKSVLAITHVAVIDATGAPPQLDMTLLIADQRIATIGPSNSTTVPHSAQILDATGKFLIPGLADMHVHLTGAGEPSGSRNFMLPLLVAHGITTVRDMGGAVDQLTALRQEVESGKQIGPRIFFTGPFLDGEPPAFQPSIAIHNEAEGRAAVRSLQAQGVDFIKTQSRLSRDAYFAIAEECRRQNIRFVGHVPDTVSALEASEAGQSSIEHLTGILLGYSMKEDELRREILAQVAPGQTSAQSKASFEKWVRKLLNTQSPSRAFALNQEFVKNKTWQVPTFPVLVDLAFVTPKTDMADDPRMKCIPGRLRSIWEQGRRERLNGLTPETIALREQVVQKSLEAVGRMNAAGVRFLAGTDSAAPNVFPGSSLHEDLAYLVQAGLTPMQSLQAATKSPAEFLGKLQTQGTIEPGKFADLLLLDANPLDDIHNTQRIRAVLLHGRILDRKMLDGLLEAEEKFAASH